MNIPSFKEQSVNYTNHLRDIERWMMALSFMQNSNSLT